MKDRDRKDHKLTPLFHEQSSADGDDILTAATLSSEQQIKLRRRGKSVDGLLYHSMSQ